MRVGCKSKSRSRATERVDQHGQRVDVQQVTVLNVLEFPVDAAQYALTAAEKVAIERDGIYCMSFESVLPYFDYTASQHWCREVWCEARQIMQASTMPSGHVATVLLLVARPQYHTAPTYVNYNDCIPDCDTNSYAYTVKYLQVLMLSTVGSLVR